MEMLLQLYGMNLVVKGCKGGARMVRIMLRRD